MLHVIRTNRDMIFVHDIVSSVFRRVQKESKS